MSTMITYKLFDIDPLVQIMPSVNPVPLDNIYWQRINTGPFKRSFVVDYVGSKAGAGGLLTWKSLPLPVFNGSVLPYVKFRWKAYISSFNLFNLWRFENDIKGVFTAAPNAASQIANVHNGSCQFKPVPAGGWSFQIDKSGGGWVDSGQQIAAIPADSLVQYETAMFMDTVNSQFSFLSFSLNGAVQAVPASMQKLPLQTSNWAAGLAAQVQVEIVAPGSCQVIYQDPEICCSDVAFS